MAAPRKDEAKRLDQLIEMLREISADPDPVTSVYRFRMTIRKLYGDLGLLSISKRGVGPGQYRVIRVLTTKASTRRNTPTSNSRD
jgi:hypothetical protein